MSNPITVKGYVCSVPRAADARQASVAVVQDDVEYRIIARGAGADLADEVSARVEVTGLLEQVDAGGGRCRAVSRLPQDGMAVMSAARQACRSGRASPGTSFGT